MKDMHRSNSPPHKPSRIQKHPITNAVSSNERLRQLTCLYGICSLAGREDVSIHEILQEAVALIPAAWQHSDVACAQITFNGETFKTDNFHETRWKQSADLQVAGSRVGTVDVCYLQERPSQDEAPFLKAERSLLNEIAENLGKIIEQTGVQDELVAERAALELSIDAISMCDMKGRVTYANSAFCKLWGCSPEEVPGRSAASFMERPEMVARVFEELQRSGGWRGELTARRSDESTFDVMLSATLVTKNETAGVMMAVFHDITERKKAEEALKESEERYKAIFEGASDGFLAVDMKTNKFVFANPKICEMTGYSLKELLELNVNDIHPKKDLPFIIGEFTKQAQGTLDVAKDIPVLRKDKTVLYCDINSTVMEIGEQKRLVGFFRDITERKRMEAKLHEYASHLEKLVEERTQKLAVSERRFRELADLLPQTVLETDETGNLTFTNRTGFAVTGYTQEDIERRTAPHPSARAGRSRESTQSRDASIERPAANRQGVHRTQERRQHVPNHCGSRPHHSRRQNRRCARGRHRHHKA